MHTWVVLSVLALATAGAAYTLWMAEQRLLAHTEATSARTPELPVRGAPRPLEYPATVLTGSAATRYLEDVAAGAEGDPLPNLAIIDGPLAGAPEVSPEGTLLIAAIGGAGEAVAYYETTRIDSRVVDLELPSGDWMMVAVQGLEFAGDVNIPLAPHAILTTIAGFEAALEVEHSTQGPVTYGATIITPDHRIRIVVFAALPNPLALGLPELEVLVADLASDLARHLAEG